MNVQETIDSVLKNTDKEKAKDYAQTSFHVGSLSGCLRGAYLERKGEHVKMPYDARKLRVFKMGNLVEEFVEDCLTKAGKIVETQGRLEWPEFNLSGRFDFLTLDEERGYGVNECKSVHSGAFHWAKKRDGKPSDSKLMQVAMYHDKLKERFPQLYASVIDVSKDDLCINEYVLTADDIEEYASQGRDNALILKACWDNDELPPMAPSIIEEFGKYKLNWKAAYCNLHHICTGDVEWKTKAEENVKSMNKG